MTDTGTRREKEPPGSGKTNTVSQDAPDENAPESSQPARITPDTEALIKEIDDPTQKKSEGSRFRVTGPETEEQYGILFQSTCDGILINDDKGVITEWNPAMERIFGITREEAIGHTLPEISSRCIPCDTRSKGTEKWVLSVIDRMDRQASSRQRSPFVEIPFMRPDGGIRIIEAGHFSFEVRGHTFYGGIVRDITGRRRAEESTQKREEEFQSMIESTSDGILLTDEEGRITRFNEAHERLTGMAAEEVIGLPVWQIQAARSSPDRHGTDPLTWYKQVWERLLHDENDQFHREIFEDEITSKNGETHKVQVRAFRIPTRKGFRVGAIVRDITEQKRVEEALLESEETYRTLIEMSPDAIVIHEEGTILYANPATACLFHSSHPEDIVGKNAFTVIHPDSHPISRTVAGRDLEGINTPPTEIQVIRKDGTILTLEGRGRRIQYQGKAAVEVILRDVTERKKSEQQLQEYAADLKRSNEDLELFAYIATHDLQEPIRGIVSYSQLLLAEGGQDQSSQTRKYLEIIAGDGLRLHTLMSDLREYLRVRSGGRPFVPTDMEGVLENALHTLHLEIAESRAAITHDPLPTVPADRSQITQVMQNLLSNAMKFQQKGTVPFIHVSACPRDGMWQFSVRDNGIGIQKEYFQKIFILFERLYPRNAYPGTGLGLALCKQIIERHGGRIWVESDERGSTFFFTLPFKPPESRMGNQCGGNPLV